jgi:hypothetical protein
MCRVSTDGLSIPGGLVRRVNEHGFGPTAAKSRQSPRPVPRRDNVRFLSIYTAKESNQPPTPEHIARMNQLIEEMTRAGVLIGTEGCLPTAQGARVRVADGTYTVTDGPFAEAREVVGGFALLEAHSKEAAIEATKRFLNVVGEGECEIRQLYEVPATSFTRTQFGMDSE